MTVNPNTNLPFSEDEIRERCVRPCSPVLSLFSKNVVALSFPFRFQALQEQGVKHISLWQMPVPEVNLSPADSLSTPTCPCHPRPSSFPSPSRCVQNWWPFLEAFVA